MENNLPRLSYYDSRWKKRFLEEKNDLLTIIPANIKAHVYHIGSTAVDGLVARSIIDVVIGVENPLDIYTVKDLLVFHNYVFLTNNSGLDNIVLYKRRNDGIEYILHLTKYNSDSFKAMLKTVKVLSENKALAKQYAELKARLVNQKADLKLYSQEKQKFIRENLR